MLLLTAFRRLGALGPHNEQGLSAPPESKGGTQEASGVPPGRPRTTCPEEVLVEPSQAHRCRVEPGNGPARVPVSSLHCAIPWQALQGFSEKQHLCGHRLGPPQALQWVSRHVSGLSGLGSLPPGAGGRTSLGPVSVGWLMCCRWPLPGALGGASR